MTADPLRVLSNGSPPPSAAYRTGRRTVGWAALMLPLVALALAGCRGEPGTAPGGEHTVEVTTPRAQLETAGASEGSGELERAVGLTFGLPLPAGLDLIERDDDLARFSSPYPLEALTDFYDRELTTHHRVDGPDGTKYEPDDPDGTAIYLLEEPDQLEVAYVRSAADLTALERARPGETAQGSRATPPWAAHRRPWTERRVPRIPIQILDDFLAEQRRGSVAGGGGQFYRERYEEVDGQRVRVLTLRDALGDSLLERQDQPAPRAYPEAWHRLPRRPGGSYDRGDGQRSLRPSPVLGEDGQPRPYVTGRHYDVDPSIPH